VLLLTSSVLLSAIGKAICKEKEQLLRVIRLVFLVNRRNTLLGFCLLQAFMLGIGTNRGVDKAAKQDNKTYRQHDFCQLYVISSMHSEIC